MHTQADKTVTGRARPPMNNYFVFSQAFFLLIQTFTGLTGKKQRPLVRHLEISISLDYLPQFPA